MAEVVINNCRVICRLEGRELYQDDNMDVMTNRDVRHLEAEEISRNQFAFADNESAYKDDSLMQQLLKIKFPKILLIIFPICLIGFIIGFFIADYHINKTTPNAESITTENINLLNSILISSDNKIWALDLTTKKSQPLLTSINEITSLDPYLNETIYWTESNFSSINSLFPNQPNLTHTNRLQSQAIAIDYLTDKMYFLDKQSGSLLIHDIRNKHFGVVYADLEEPHDLVLDPPEGLMFIVQYHKSILKANMDGSGLRTIMESYRVSALTIDRKATRLYWANDGTNIESSDYDGGSRQTVISIPLNVASLALAENRLYWTRSSGWSELCPCSNVLWSCGLYRRACSNASAIQLPFSNPKLLRGPAPVKQHEGPCSKGNGGCSQLCLMTSRGSHGCGCSVGWRLQSDGRTCLPVAKILIYLQGDYARGRVLGVAKDEPFASALIPTRFRADLVKKNSVNFDYDWATGELYFSDDRCIYKINMLKDEEQIKLLDTPAGYLINDLVYDWVKESLLYVRQSIEATNNHSIISLALRGTQQQSGKQRGVLLSAKYKKEPHIDCFNDLAIHPEHEYLFFSDYNGVNDNLRRVSTSGKGLILWKPFYSNVQLNFVTVDVERGRIYWATSASPSHVKSANLEGSEEESVQVTGVTNVVYAAVADWLYLGNVTEIWTVRRDNGAELARLVKARRFRRISDPKTGYETVHGIKVYSLNMKNGR